jgi:Trypsin-like peptidase domain
MISPLILAATRVSTFDGERALTAASGFLFERDGAMFLVTCRHVLLDEAADHRPNRVEIELHTDLSDLTRTHLISIWLYQDGLALWRQGGDAGGDIDVAAIRIDRAELPPMQGWRCFTPAHLQDDLQAIELGSSLLIVGFPLGFHDTVHRLAVARQAGVASAFGVRFQGQGLFLTDARTHRGSSGSPVVMHDPQGNPALPWKLLGIHSSRIDMSTRDRVEDEALGLNNAWYADILLTLTAPP